MKITDEYATCYYNDLGQYHREDGPAIIYPNGHKEWLINGMYHRIDGPAIEYADGSKAWYLYGEKLTKTKYRKKKKHCKMPDYLK